MISQEYLKSILSYEPSTGLFRWKVRFYRYKIGAVAGGFTNGYIRIRINGIQYYAHQLAILYMTGKWPTLDTDHKDRNKSNNRWENIRPATPMQNRANSHSVANATGYKGVTLRVRDGRYDASIYVDYKRIYLGTFDRAENAALYYNFAALRYFGEFARYNV